MPLSLSHQKPIVFNYYCRLYNHPFYYVHYVFTSIPISSQKYKYTHTPTIMQSTTSYLYMNIRQGAAAASSTPTKSPIFVTLPNVGGCPSNFTTNYAYEAGSRISVGNIVYQCKSWPSSLYCPQAAYKPTDPTTSTTSTTNTTSYWQLAWDMVGHCSGILRGTNSPTTASGGGGCPPAWTAGGLSTYKENDRVSEVKMYDEDDDDATTISTMVYKCKAWPLSGYCGQFSPTHPSGGSLGWDIVGGCSGTIQPTPAPTFAVGSVVTAGCPTDYNEAVTTYKSGDQVSKSISSSTTHKMVYKCREYPDGLYCNQKGFAPGSEYSAMAWTQVGPCTGTLVPTASPTEFTSACKYIKVVTSPFSSTPTRVVMDIAKWTSGVSYVEGDLIRVDGMTYQCKPWPYYFWCSNSAYQPTTSTTGLWTEAWTFIGPCQSNVSLG